MFVDTEKLILEVEKRPCIWLTLNNEYKKKDVKDDAWDEIGKVMYPAYSGVELQNRVKEIRKKWTNIRDSYRKHLKEQEENSQDPPTFKKRKYIYAEMLQFLNPVFKSKTSGANYEDLDQKNEASVIYSTEECQKLTPFSSKDKSSSTKASPANMPPSAKVSHPSCISPSISASPCPNMPLSSGTPSEGCEIKREKEKPTLRRDFLEILNSPQNVSKVRTDEDADKAFLLSCLPDMRSFNEFQKIQFKRAVLDSIQNIKFPQSK